MRSPRFIMSVVIAVLAVVVLGSLATAKTGASVPEAELKAVYPNYLLPGVNQACPEGSQKVFNISFSVPKGSRIKQAGEFYLVLKHDVLVAEPERVNKRLVEYHLYPRSRKAKLKNFRDMRFNLAYAAYTSHDYTLVLSKDCINKEY